MDISSYTFQSPYPTQVQIGRPDPSAKQQAQQTEAVDAFKKVEEQTTQQRSEAYVAQKQTTASVNVATVSTDSGVNTALSTFTTTNKQLQAVQAYSSQ